MSRELTPDFVERIASYSITPVYFISLDILPDPVRVWTGLGPIQFKGETWLGGLGIGSVEPIKESAVIKAETLKFSLFADPQAGIDLSELGDKTYHGRRAEVYLALLGDDMLPVVSDLSFCGLMQTMAVKLGEDRYVIELTAANELIRLRQVWGSLHSGSDQKSLHPDDTSHRFIPAIQNVTISF